MRALAGRRVLLVEDDEDGRFLLGEGLGMHGAEVRAAGSAEDALELIKSWQPDVLVSDLALPGMDGNALLGLVREFPELQHLPGIALTGHGGQAYRDAAFKAGFAKHLLKPAKISDLVAAILAMEVRLVPPSREVRAILAEVNHASPCRFTSLLRFGDDDKLVSVWTYDRENPAVDPFPLGLPIDASYCVYVRAAASTYVVENSPADPRTVGHPKRDELATYIGVPLYRPDGQMFGTVCSFDPRPLTLDASVRETIERATRELESMMTALDAQQ